MNNKTQRPIEVPVRPITEGANIKGGVKPAPKSPPPTTVGRKGT